MDLLRAVADAVSLVENAEVSGNPVPPAMVAESKKGLRELLELSIARASDLQQED